MTNLNFEHLEADDPKNLIETIRNTAFTTMPKLELTSQLANKVIQNLNEGIVITNTEGKILHVNKAYSEITGYSEEELLGGNPRILKSNLHDRFFYHRIWNSVLANGSWKGQIWNRHKSGRLYLQKLYIIQIRDDKNETPLYLGVSTDISEEDQIHKDISRTGKLQFSLLPEPIHDKKLQVDSIFVPANYLSGDFFDYDWEEEGSILSGFMIDIMGHGLTSAFQHSILRVLFNQKFTKESSLVKVLTEINHESRDYFLEDTFAAALCFRLDLYNRKLTYACAGMNKFLLVHKNGEMTMVKQPGPYLGIVKDEEFEENSIPIESGDSIFFLTDGLMDVIEREGNHSISTHFHDNMDRFRGMSKQGLKDDASAIGIYIL